MLDQWIIENADDLQVILFFTLFGVFAAAELFAPRRSGQMRRRQRWATNLSLTALNIVVLSLLPVTFFAAAVWAQGRGLGLFNLVSLPVAVAVLCTLLGRAFISFFTHWLMHRIPLFWRLHRVHHLDTEMDVSTTVRVHPFEFVVNLAVGVLFVMFLGMAPWVLLLYEVLDACVTLFSHANISLPPAAERVVRYIIVTPDLHRVHHSSLQPETDSNFGAVFPVWDIILGTFRTKTRLPQELMELGLEEVRDRRADDVLWLLTSPARASLDEAEPSPHQPTRYRKGAVMTTRRSPFKPPTLLLILLVAMTAAHFFLPLTPVLPFPWSLGGAVFVAAGIALNVIADRLFKGYGCVSACRGPDVLVTGGPYALSRNPMYLGFAFILFGTALMLGSLSPLLVAAIFVPLTNSLYIKHEEAELAGHEADAWSAYTARVRRWL